MSDVYQQIVFYSGHVQGVGFRYTTRQVAKEFEVTGTVKNLADGRVELEAHGSEAEVKAFVSAVAERMHGYIRKTEEKSTRGPRRFNDFSII